MSSSAQREPPEFFTILPDRGEFRPRAETTLWPAIRMVTRAFEYAREQNIQKLLVNVTGLTGFAPPNVGERYHMVHEWADAARGQVRAACVASREMIDPERFGVTVGKNSGFPVNVFTSEDEALAWLQNSE